MRAPFWSQKIIDRAAELFGITRADLVSPSRFHIHAHPRFLAAKAMRELGMSYPEIGRRLNRSDHSTIINACEKAEIYMERRPYMRAAYEEIFNAAVPGFYPADEQ